MPPEANNSCSCPPHRLDPCTSDVGLAAGIGVLVAGSVLLLAWLTFYYCQKRRFAPHHPSYTGSHKRSLQDKNLHGNYFGDAGDSYLLTGETPVEFAYFDDEPGTVELQRLGNRECAEAKSPALLFNNEGKQNDHIDAARSHTTQSAAINLNDGTTASASFSPSLGDKANFPILAPATDSLPVAGSSSSVHSSAMDLSFWPSLPLESEVDLRPSVLMCDITPQGGVFRSEPMRVEVHVEVEAVTEPVHFTLGMSLRPEDQPEIDQAAALVTALYSCSPMGATLNKPCRLRVPLTCHLMDLDEDDAEAAAEAMPQVNNLIVMRNEVSGESSSEWRDVGPVYDFTEYSGRHESSDDLVGFVDFEVASPGLYTVRCDGGIWVKSMCLSHFAAALGEDQCWAFRVFLHRDKKSDYERLCQYASEFNMRPVGMPQPFHLPQHSYVHVLVSSITEGCALEGSSHGVLHGEGCWPNLEQPPFVEFRLRQIHGCLPFPLVRVRMDVVIADDYDNITFELLSQWSTQAQMKMDKMMPDDLMNKAEPSGGWPWTLMSPWQQLTNEQVQQLKTILDRPLMGDQDYSTLAAMLGYSEDQVKIFSMQRPSPTEALLKDLHTRLPVLRVSDRLLVALGRMGAVWLCDYLRQACRVDRVQQREERFRDSAQLSDTLKRRFRPGRNSANYSQDEQKRESVEINTRASHHRYQRRVQRVSGRGSQLSKSRLSLPGTVTAALTNRKSNTKQPENGVVAQEEKNQKNSNAPPGSMQRPLLAQNSPDSEESGGRAVSPLTQWANDSERIQSLLDSHNSGQNHGAIMAAKRSSARFSQEAGHSQTLVMERRGYMMQVVGPSGGGPQSPTLFTVHRDGSMPNRAILQPVPVLLPSQSQDATGSQTFLQRVAKALSRTTSAPGTDQNEFANRRATSVRMQKKASLSIEPNPVWLSMPSVDDRSMHAKSTGTCPARIKANKAPKAYLPGTSRQRSQESTGRGQSCSDPVQSNTSLTNSAISTPPRKESLGAPPLPKTT